MTKPKPIPTETGLIRARQRKDGTTAYRAVWDAKEAGEWKQHSRTFDSVAAAQDFLRGIAREKREGRSGAPSRMTVAELVAEYIARAETSKRITGRSAFTYRDRAASMIAPTIGQRRLAGLQPLDVQRWIDSLSPAFAPSTIRAAVAVLMGALREAALLGITDRHLGQGVRRPPLDTKPATTWTLEQTRRVLAFVRDDPLWGALYLCAVATGMRSGELRALKWRDVDLDAGVLIVKRTMTKDALGRTADEERTKSRKPRAVALAPELVERLRWHRARQNERRLARADWEDRDLVFDRYNGGVLHQSRWYRKHVAVCEEVGVPTIRLHDIRHSSASLELEMGTHMKIVSERLGHAKISTTMDLYSHVSAESQRKAADALTARLVDEDVG